MPRRETPLPGVRAVTLSSGEQRYEVVLNLGTGATGKRRMLRRRFATLAHANRWRVDQLRKRDDGSLSDDEGMTVEALCRRWLDLPSPRRGGNTRMTYRSALEHHIYPGLGTVRVAQLTTMRLQRHYDTLLAERGVDILRTAHKALSGAMGQALAWGLCAKNPCQGVILPVPEPQEAVRLSLDETARLIIAAKDDPVCGAVVVLMAYTGLRIGEVLALSWDGVDLEAGVLDVRARITRDDDGVLVIVAGAKSKSGRRSLALGPEVVALLRRQRATQNEWRLALGEGWEDTGLVFTRETGMALYHRAVSRALDRICQAAGLAPMTRTHNLRYTNATLSGEIADHDELLTLQRRLGHAAIEMTLAYSKPGVEGQRAGAERLEDRLRKAMDG